MRSRIGLPEFDDLPLPDRRSYANLIAGFFETETDQNDQTLLLITIEAYTVAIKLAEKNRKEYPIGSDI